MKVYDIITVGGGVGGSALAKAMAEQGRRVLIVEHQTKFKDRVRGEFIFPWGVAEAQELGVYDALIAAGGHHPHYWAEYAGPDALSQRDFAQDTPQKLHGLSMHHPWMQDALLEEARRAGAELERGVRVRGVEPGAEPRVHLEGGRSVSARLVVGADGRGSMVRGWAGFQYRTDPPGNLFAGVLLENAPASAEASICMVNPLALRMVVYFPQAGGRGRAYLASTAEEDLRLQGRPDFNRFLEECAQSGLAAGLLDGARQAGPLATFDGADSWVEHPYSNGVALIGDAAATSDPTWGQGLALTFRDARSLRDALLAEDDWNSAGHAYAAEHDVYYEKVRTTNSWFSQVFMRPGPESDALRARVLPQMETDPAVLPDTQISGPDFAPPSAAHRAKIFGEETAGAAVAEM